MFEVEFLLSFSDIKMSRTAQKMKFSNKDFFYPQFPPNLVTFTKEIFTGKFDFLCSVH